MRQVVLDLVKAVKCTREFVKILRKFLTQQALNNLELPSQVLVLKLGFFWIFDREKASRQAEVFSEVLIGDHLNTFLGLHLVRTRSFQTACKLSQDALPLIFFLLLLASKSAS